MYVRCMINGVIIAAFATIHLHAVIIEARIYWFPGGRYIFTFGDAHQPSTEIDECQLNELLKNFSEVDPQDSYHVLIEQPSRLTCSSHYHPYVLGSLKERLVALQSPRIYVEDIERRCAVGAALTLLDQHNDPERMRHFLFDTGDRVCDMQHVTGSHVLNEIHALRDSVDPIRELVHGQVKETAMQDLATIDRNIRDLEVQLENEKEIPIYQQARTNLRDALRSRISATSARIFDLLLARRILELKTETDRTIVAVAGWFHTSNLSNYLRGGIQAHESTWCSDEPNGTLTLQKPWVNPIKKLYFNLSN